MRIDELRRLRDLLARGGGPEALFMSLRDRSLQGPALAKALGDELRRWLTIASPERFGGNPEAQDLAKRLQHELNALHAEALRRVTAPTADAPIVQPAQADIPAAADPYRISPVEPPAPAPPPGLFVDIDGTTREFAERLGDGDLAEIWRSAGHDGDPCVAKVARAAGDNDLVFNEAEALKKLHAGDARERELLPRLHGRFFTRDARAGNLLGLVEGLSGPELRRRLPAGVPPEHIIWIGRRALSVLGHAHNLGIIHGNIEPAHLIVRPRDHRVVVIDWCYSVVDPVRTRQGFRAVHDVYSAPEVAERGPPTPAADLFSLGRTLAYLLGADPIALDLPAHVPDRLQRVIRYLARPSRLQRAQDAWDMFSELAGVRQALYGPHVFQEFIV